MPKVNSINHVAVVVEDMDKALAFWRDALGIDLHELREVPAEKSQVAFLPLAGAEVELVRPTTDDSGIAKYLAKRGPGMHHLCLEVDDIESMLAQLKAKNIRLINEEPRAKRGRGTAASAVAKVVWIVRPRAAPRSASRNSSQPIGVVASSCESCQVLIASTVKPATISARGPILS